MKEKPMYLVRDVIKLEIISELQDLYGEKINLEKIFPEDEKIEELSEKISFWQVAMFDEKLLNDLDFNSLEKLIKEKNFDFLNDELEILKKIIKINVTSLLR